MGFDCGFDIYPRLEATAVNKQSYQRFLDEVISTFQNTHDKNGRRPDGKVLTLPDDPIEGDKVYIQFMVGECPHMPCNPERCDYFLRFSSKVSGHLTTPAEPYIKRVCNIARKHFGGRVHFWHELCETNDERQWGCYDWLQVYDARRELRELEKGQDQDETNCTNDEPTGSSMAAPKT
ncbi:hypothetical protein PT974_07473 [Cladobotryum mycophilum]|uniref:Uncharacterized protein n=1 Tax=Cladobotryum mycophilum TaxID=491253 RepID=A0ABR0SPC7_9HYPO